MSIGEVQMRFPLGPVVGEEENASTEEVIKSTHTIDVLGFFCPVPIAEAKKLLQKMQIGEILEVWSDDPEVLHDMPLLLERTGDELLSIEENAGEYRILIRRLE